MEVRLDKMIHQSPKECRVGDVCVCESIDCGRCVYNIKIEIETQRTVSVFQSPRDGKSL